MAKSFSTQPLNFNKFYAALFVLSRSPGVQIVTLHEIKRTLFCLHAIPFWSALLAIADNLRAWIEHRIWLLSWSPFSPA